MVKSWVVRTLGVAILLLLLSATVSAQTRSNNWIKGAWEGTGYQTDDQSTWTMRLTARGRRFSIEYPSLNCGGRWQLVSINAYRARFRESLRFVFAPLRETFFVKLRFT